MCVGYSRLFLPITFAKLSVSAPLNHLRWQTKIDNGGGASRRENSIIRVQRWRRIIPPRRIRRLCPLGSRLLLRYFCADRLGDQLGHGPRVFDVSFVCAWCRDFDGIRVSWYEGCGVFKCEDYYFGTATGIECVF